MKQVRLLFFATIVFVSCQTSLKYSGNPILPDFHADPSARVMDGKIWIFPSHDVPGSKYYWEMVDWHAFSSKDLVQWTDHGVVFSLAQTNWAKRYAWAPDAIKRNGKYYFYFCASTDSGSAKGCANALGIAIADKPYGPYRDAIGAPFITTAEAQSNAMDPCVFIDDDKQAYLYFGQNELKVIKLKDDMITRDGEIETLEVKNFHEGIWMHKHKGKYYLSYPEYDGENAGKLAYSIGDSPYGPFVYKGVIMDNKSRNIHHSIVEYKGHWYVFYHIQGPSPYERRVCAEFLKYNEDGTIKPIEMTKKSN